MNLTIREHERLKILETRAYFTAKANGYTTAGSVIEYHQEIKGAVVRALDLGMVSPYHRAVQTFIAFDRADNKEGGATVDYERAVMVGRDGRPKTFEEMVRAR